MMPKVALITGASRGLGRSLSSFLAGMGYDLILSARGREALEQHASGLSEFGVRVAAVVGDVSNEGHRTELVQAVEAAGGLSLMVNNASELGPSPLPNLENYPLDEFRKVLDVNLIAPLRLIQVTLPFLIAEKGWIVNISSDAAVGGYPGWGGYGASKAGFDLVSLTLANELKTKGVTVVSVDPGDMRTDLHQAAFPGEDISDRPLPDVTIPFWAWLISQDSLAVNGRRFQAQAELWVADLERIS